MILIDDDKTMRKDITEVLDQFDFNYSEEMSMDFSISAFVRDSWREIFK